MGGSGQVLSPQLETMGGSGQEFYIEGSSVIVLKTGSPSSPSKDQTILVMLKDPLVDGRVAVKTYLAKMLL
ncbi:unnamed protein product [Heligmosomoides polygyrus]|uniref:NTF2 domain-containing protein n=1 Tax=Heligmosomoides polygyrus TaxID=6339 RepID=A0A183FS70_HELPZ|nr:unnamed protein product [Heligmosomoides polygyrus]